MDNPEKLATQGQQDDQNINTAQYAVEHHYMQANTNNAKKT